MHRGVTGGDPGDVFLLRSLAPVISVRCNERAWSLTLNVGQAAGEFFWQLTHSHSQYLTTSIFYPTVWCFRTCPGTQIRTIKAGLVFLVRPMITTECFPDTSHIQPFTAIHAVVAEGV